MFLFLTACKDKFPRQDVTIDVSYSSVEKSVKTPPREVLDAAAACFQERGYSGTTIDDVARHVGATKGRIYHYFGSKSELMDAVRKHAMDINFAAICPGYHSDLPPREKFRAMAEAHALNMIEEQAYQKALFDSLHLHITRGKDTALDARLEAFIADRRAFEDMFREVLEMGKKAGVFRIQTLSYALHTVLTTLNSSIYWYTPRTGETAEDRKAIANELVDMAMRALGVDDTNTTTTDAEGSRI
jgi:AcrR family transcriptional regulator